MSALPRYKFTYDDLVAMPDDGKHYELIEGELFVAASPIAIHQLIVTELIYLFRQVIAQTGAGIVMPAPMDVKFSDFTVLEPDVLFIAASRVDDLIRTGHVTGPPDIVVEVLSPSSRTHDATTKFKVYAGYGVPEYWIIDPVKREIAVYGLTDGGYERLPANPRGAFTSRMLPALTVDPDALFATIPGGAQPQ